MQPHESRPVVAEFALVIERGRSRYPRRPILGERFLIGAGSNCQLQLGGLMPMLHSIVLQRDGGLWIDCVVPDPMLLVNGVQIREGALQVGDRLEIGPFVFTVARQAISTAETLAAPPTAEVLLKSLTEQLQLNRQQGASALLEAAMRLNEHSQAAEHPAAVRPVSDKSAAGRSASVPIGASAPSLPERAAVVTECPPEITPTPRPAPVPAPGPAPQAAFRPLSISQLLYIEQANSTRQENAVAPEAGDEFSHRKTA
jgi:predicted component of type VI protein secretion system